MAPSRLRHQVEHTRNKHYRAVIVNDTIIIRLARNLSKREEARHIDYLLKRMAVVLAREQQKTVVHPFGRLLQGHSDETVHLESGRTLTISLRPGTRTRLHTDGDAWTVTVGPTLRTQPFHRLLWAGLSRQELPRLEALVREINRQTFQVPVRSVRLGIASSQWGSCSSRGVVMLNTALLFLPERLLRYVIIHELAHCLVPGHDAHFWSHVGEACPDYKACVRDLKRYRLPRL